MTTIEGPFVLTMVERCFSDSIKGLLENWMDGVQIRSWLLDLICFELSEDE